MKQLYSPREARKWRVRAGRGLLAACLLMGLALLACILICFQVRTGNAERLLGVVVLIFTLAGWTAILLLNLLVFPARAQAEHMEGILQGEPAVLEGVLSVSEKEFHIPKSVSVRKATLTVGEETLSLNVSARFASLLPPDGAQVRVQTVRKFITAWEVQHEDR